MYECPKDQCFNWISPGGSADISGMVWESLKQSFEKGNWKSFPDGGCSCIGRCIRLYEDGEDDFFEPNNAEETEIEDIELDRDYLP